MSLARRLYRGETTFALIEKRRRFYGLSVALTSIALLSMLIQGFNLGVEFKGGATFQFPANGRTVEDARQTFEQLDVGQVIPQTLGRSGSDEVDLRVETEPLTPAQVDTVIAAVQRDFDISDPNLINPSSVGPEWGDQVTNKALQGLGLFLIAVIIYISIRFEPKMAVAAIVALVHDLILTAGIYSLTQFEVTPSTVIALLTVLGYSLYDTIVVFDKVEENVRGLAGSSRSTYSEAAELAVNQTFMRSINTSLIALLPVSGLLFVGAFLLGAGTLKDLALALFVGLGAGAYSSLFLATPLLTDLKEREPQYRALTARVLAKRSGTGRSSLRAKAATAAATGAAPAAATGASTGRAAGSVAVVGPGATDDAPEAPAAVAPAAPPRRPAPKPAKRKGGGGRPSGKRR
ncbi:MAG TPA: protein translocase subunit SecF [Mycobacteriales bacterium]|jgi:preprotein translocase subunit SecF|nr:protein translocase subunit SecF [Mycobacteriales bacterium]